MYLKLGKSFDEEERQFISQYLCEISFGNKVLCGPSSWHQWVNILIYDRTLVKNENFGYQMFIKFIDIFDWFVRNQRRFYLRDFSLTRIFELPNVDLLT